MCIYDTPYGVVMKARLIGTLFFQAGICTLLQTIFGLRLPIIQGGTFSFLAATFATLGTDELKCPSFESNLQNSTVMDSYPVNTTIFTFLDNDDVIRTEEELWFKRIHTLQAAILVAGLVEVGVGALGLVGLLKKIIGPLPIAVFISLVGLALVDVSAGQAGKYWPIGLLVIILLALFSEVLARYDVPCIACKVETKKVNKVISKPTGVGFKSTKFPLFKTFPVVLAVGFTWFIS